MIRLITGPLGMGKTLFATMDMFDALCKGSTVVTNIQVVWPEMKRLAARLRGVRLEDEQLVLVNPEDDKNWESKIPWGSMGAFVEVYFDEMHLFYNARDWQKTGIENRSLLSFLTQSRKACVNIVFITQSKENLEKQFREMAEWEFAVISSQHIPVYIFQILPWKFFLVKVNDMRKGHTVRRVWRYYDKRFWKCYSSFSFLDKEMAEMAKGVRRVERRRLQRVSFRHRTWLNLIEPFRPLVAWIRKVRQKPSKLSA